MDDPAFDRLEGALRSEGCEQTFDLLAQTFRERKEYARLFETRLMKARRALGLPLIQVDSADDLPAEKRRVYEEAFIAAAREVGGLFLAEGDIPRAWSYFRAIGESAPVAVAIEKLEPREGMEAVLEIAYHERVNPRRGFELILAQYGVCRAITAFDQYPGREGREECLGLLVRTLYTDLVESLKRTIVQREQAEPPAQGIRELIAGREWLFEDNAYYIDTSHVASVLRLSLEARDPNVLRQALELAEYGTHLSPMFHYRSEPPFEDIYADHGMYLRALTGDDEEGAIAHFRRKVAECAPEEAGTIPAQVLVSLLERLKRYGEAIGVSLEHLRDADFSQLACPSVVQLCELAGDYERLKQVARERGDLLSFAAGAMGTGAA
jgi:hypothetical protein